MFKEKSWSVRLVHGYVQNNQVRSDRCRGCESSTKLIVANNGEPDSQLYGCYGHKCKHILIRIKFSEPVHEPDEYLQNLIDIKPLEDKFTQRIPPEAGIPPITIPPLMVHVGH